MPRYVLPYLFSIFLLASMSACSAVEPAPPLAVEIRLAAQDIRWDMNRIEAKVGHPLVMLITNEGLLDHNFEIAAMEINENIAPGETIELELTFDHPGEFEFKCNVPGHAEAGMAGTIVVSE